MSVAQHYYYIFFFSTSVNSNGVHLFTTDSPKATTNIYNLTNYLTSYSWIVWTACMGNRQPSHYHHRIQNTSPFSTIIWPNTLTNGMEWRELWKLKPAFFWIATETTRHAYYYHCKEKHHFGFLNNAQLPFVPIRDTLLTQYTYYYFLIILTQPST